MPIEWREYDAFDWAGAQQAPMTPEQRDAVAELAADLLELPPEDRAKLWGSASPPGRYAATVIHVASGVLHSYREKAAAARVAEVGVKVFKTTADARREAQKVLPFHRLDAHRLPGLPNDRVQRSLDAGVRRDRAGQERAFIVQEWVDGDTLETLIRRRWPTEPLDGTRARSILEQLLAGIIIPLWGVGTVWWDVRAANYCYAASTGRLTLIDLDSLAAYADEILRTPDVWTRREKGRATALARLRQLSLRVLLGQGPPSKKRIETSLSQAWQAELEPALVGLGRASGQTEAALLALQRFLQALEEPA